MRCQRGDLGGQVSHEAELQFVDCVSSRRFEKQGRIVTMGENSVIARIAICDGIDEIVQRGGEKKRIVAGVALCELLAAFAGPCCWIRKI